MDKYKWLTPLGKQVWTVSFVQLTVFGMGMSISYPSSLLPGLREPDSTIQVDLHTASWLVSSIGISSIPGYFLSSFLMDYSGRRIGFIVMLLLAILGWFSIYSASTVQVLMIGRILNGISVGGCTILCAIAIGEYTSPGYRGVFLNLKAAFFSMGCLLVHILANYLFWRTLALIALIPNTMAVLIILTCPESPVWLASKKQFEECKDAFVWLRGTDEYSIKELDELIKVQNNRISGLKLRTVSTLDEVVIFLKKFTRMDFLKPILIIFLSMTLMELSGRHMFPAYAVDIIDELTGDKSQSFYYIIGLDIVVMASTTFSAVLAKFMTRRRLLFFTGWAAVAVLAIFCTYLFVVPTDTGKNYYRIPISILIVYFIFAFLGCTPIPFCILGEIIPLAHRAAGSAVGGLILSFSLYLVLHIAPYLLASIKVRGTFAVLGAGMAVCLLVLYFILPETKDRTLQEIDNYFTYGRYTVDQSSDDENNEKSKMMETNVNIK